MGTAWKMPIAAIGKPTGDGRQFDEGALSHRDLPLPLRYVASDSGGHSNAVIVGHISKIGKEKDGLLPAAGEFYDDDSWPEDVRNAATSAMKFTGNKVIGPSVDLDQAEMERVPEPKAYAAWQKEQRGKLKAAKAEHAAATGGDCGCGDAPAVMAQDAYDGPHLKMVRSGRVASATLVHIPAFAELSGHAVLTPLAEPKEVAASADPDKIENDAVMAACHGEEDETSKEMTAASGIWLTDDDYDTYAAADVTKAAVRKKLDSEDFVDPKGRRFPIASCGDIGDAVSSYGRANPKIPFEQFKSRLTAIAKRKGCEGSLPDDWKAGEKMAALMAGAAPTAPPADWFDNPNLTGPTPLHISDDGRVYGHVAVWGTCHVGIGDSCVQPPKSLTSYAYFHTGEMVTADGSRVAVGRLTYGGGHAQPNLGYRAAAEHYDHTSNTGAYVRAGEDEHGIWVAGVLAPEADDNAVRQMRAAPLSGDWRRIGGNLEMVAALHVNTAGFPIPRVLTAAGDEPYSLVAAGAIPRVAEEGAEQASLAAALDTDALGRAIARGMLAEQDARAAAEQRRQEWAELVASATADDPAADYSEALGELLVALVD